MPTPSVEVTIRGFLILYCPRSNTDPKPPIFLKFLISLPLIFVDFDNLEMNLTKFVVF